MPSCARKLATWDALPRFTLYYRFHQLPDRSADLLHFPCGWNAFHPAGFGFGNGLVAFGHALKKGPVRLFDSVAHEWQSSLSRQPPFLTDRGGNQQEQSQVG